jgi:hypothetical protein
MSGPIRLYHELHRALKRLGKWGRPESMQTLALLMTGIFNSRDVRLSRIAEQVPLDIQEDSVAQRFCHFTGDNVPVVNTQSAG